MTEDESAIYSVCLTCGSKRVKVTGEPKFSDTNIVTCTQCGDFWTLGDFNRANSERIRQLLDVDRKSD